MLYTLILCAGNWICFNYLFWYTCSFYLRYIIIFCTLLFCTLLLFYYLFCTIIFILCSFIIYFISNSFYLFYIEVLFIFAFRFLCCPLLWMHIITSYLKFIYYLLAKRENYVTTAHRCKWYWDCLQWRY